MARTKNDPKLEQYKALLIAITADIDRNMSRLIRTVNRIDGMRKRKKRYEREVARATAGLFREYAKKASNLR